MASWKDAYTWRNLLRRPDIKTFKTSSDLKRELGIWDLMGYGISSTIGAGT